MLGRDLVDFERNVVKVLCRYGKPSGDGFFFLRSRSRLKALDLARLLSTTPETISRWEHGKHEVPATAWELMVSIAKEHLARDTTTLDELERRQRQREDAPRIVQFSRVRSA